MMMRRPYPAIGHSRWLNLRGAILVLGKVRAMANKLRAPNMLASLKKKGASLPVIDVETRWGSSYMLKRVIALKEYIDDYAAAAPELQIREGMWAEIRNLCDILELPYAVTIRLQSSSLTPDNFLKEWTVLRKSLVEKGEIGIAIANSMVRRQENLFDNDVLLAAVYADLRYRILIPEELLDRAEKAFGTCMERFQRIHEALNTEIEKEEDVCSAGTNSEVRLTYNL